MKVKIKYMGTRFEYPIPEQPKLYHIVRTYMMEAENGLIAIEEERDEEQIKEGTYDMPDEDWDPNSPRWEEDDD